MKAVIRVLLAFGFAAAPIHAQAVLRLPGKTVEVIGLRAWTIPMIQDSLARYAPGTSLDSHACAAVLRYDLGFADAAAIGYQMPGDTAERVLVIVVEPQDSSRVRYRTVPMDTTRPRRAWRATVRSVAERPDVFQTALWRYTAWLRDSISAIPAYATADSIQIRDLWRFLSRQRGKSERAAALQVLRSDPNYQNRMVAVAILANFTQQDEVLYALVRALLESDGPVKSAADIVLTSFGRVSPRLVDWRPVVPELHAMLNGTGAFQLSSVMRLLVVTGSGPTLATPLLRGGGEMVLAFLAAEHPAPRTGAHDLLVALHGSDLGTGVDVWRDWISSLSR